MQEAIIKEETQLAVIAKNIETGLEAFETRKAELTELSQQATGLKIESIEDKVSINQVATIRKQLKSERVKIQKEAKTLRDPLNQINGMILDKEKELLKIIEPTEKQLQEQEKWVESEKDRIRQEEIAKEEARIQTRIDALAEFGYQIDYADIKAMSDETFTKYQEAAKAQYEKEQHEKVEQERIRLEQEEKDRTEREAQQKELEFLRKEATEREAKLKAIEADNARIEREKQELEDAKRREEDLRIAKEKAAEEARLGTIRDAKYAEEKRIADEVKAKALAERKAARQPDRIKILEYVKAVTSVPVPEMKTVDGKSVMATIQELIAKFDKYATEKAGEL